jgi:hypothetical protein
MARLYLISFNITAGTHTILDTAECIVAGNPFHFELLHVNGAKVYAVSYRATLFSCEIIDNRFSNMREITIRPGDAYHGICGCDADSVYLTNMLANTMTKYNIRTGSKEHCICDSGVRMKDVAVIDDRCLLALSSDRGPISGIMGADGTVSPYNTPYDSHLLMYERGGRGRLLRRLVLEKTQIDACVVVDRSCFVTCTDMYGVGFILHCIIDSDYTFTEIRKIPCAGFPHGISIRNGLLAYTSYSESALYIIQGFGESIITHIP